MPDQIILINKPLRWTSFDVVKKVKNTLTPPGRPGKKSPWLKVGHAGTLDPLATGLLIVCTGGLTKKISEIQGAEKEYTGTITIGSTTASFDLETETSEPVSYAHVTESQILETAKKFTGKQMQTPPAHSAVKVGGVRAYTKARNGESVEIKPKEVDIREFEITGIDLPHIYIRVVCSKGTYIRTLANDFGTVLGCGAHLSSLCRTRIGTYFLKNALIMEDFISQNSAETKLSEEIGSS
jgi:tRNA pseudouridine55 synthase